MTLWVLLRQFLTSEAGWRYGIMSTVPYDQQKLNRQINNLITLEAGLTPVNRQLVMMSMVTPSRY